MKLWGMSKRELFSRVMERTGVNKLSRMTNTWKGLLILNYHRIGDEQNTEFNKEVFSSTQENMARQFEFYKRNYNVLSMQQLLVMSPEELLKDRYLLITFDDGYRDNYELAYPVIKALKLPATIFVTTGFIDQRNISFWDEIAWMVKQSTKSEFTLSSMAERVFKLESADRNSVIMDIVSEYWSKQDADCAAFLDEIALATGTGRCPGIVADKIWMTWEMIREMASCGVDFGAHTVTHAVLSQVSLDKAKYEIVESKCRLEAELGTPVESFSYPVGHETMFTQEIKDLLKEAGIKLTFSFYGGYYPRNHWDNYNLPRAGISYFDSLEYVKTLTTWPQLLSVR
jgi:peptidoglycan/xylan/chitin deacetylase (PgdA/CDA1 family)